jgi:hypothetical protein
MTNAFDQIISSAARIRTGVSNSTASRAQANQLSSS